MSRLKGGGCTPDSYSQRIAFTGISCGSVGAVEGNPAVATESDRPNHLGPAGECNQISAAPFIGISRVFEQGERFERPAGTERSSTKLPQELNQAFARVRFECADILPPFSHLRNKPLQFIH